MLLYVVAVGVACFVVTLAALFYVRDASIRSWFLNLEIENIREELKYNPDLIHFWVNEDTQALHWVIAAGHAELIRVLIGAGAEVTTRHLFAAMHDMKLLALVLEHFHGSKMACVINAAVESKDLVALKLLMTHDAFKLDGDQKARLSSLLKKAE